jgi:hypothetical protein
MSQIMETWWSHPWGHMEIKHRNHIIMESLTDCGRTNGSIFTKGEYRAIWCKFSKTVFTLLDVVMQPGCHSRPKGYKAAFRKLSMAYYNEITMKIDIFSVKT